MIQDATPPAGEWTDFFLAELAKRDAEIEEHARIQVKLSDALNELESELGRRDAVLGWLAANNPSALELCPYKVSR